MVGASPNMDARPGSPGYAVFGRVVGGMDVVKRILAMPTNPGGEGAMKGQILTRPVTILSAQRLDGTPHPTGRAKVWLLFQDGRARRGKAAPSDLALARPAELPE